jgi:hypothetical protein
VTPLITTDGFKFYPFAPKLQRKRSRINRLAVFTDPAGFRADRRPTGHRASGMMQRQIAGLIVSASSFRAYLTAPSATFYASAVLQGWLLWDRFCRPRLELEQHRRSNGTPQIPSKIGLEGLWPQSSRGCGEDELFQYSSRSGQRGKSHAMSSQRSF